MQLDYKKKYEATKNKWIWTADRPDFVNAAKNTLQQSDVSMLLLYSVQFCVFESFLTTQCCSNVAPMVSPTG